jgi:proline iminopeptidase
MRRLLFVLILFFAGAAAPIAAQPPASYFAREGAGIQTGGARMIPIATPHGNFRVWTRRVGNNPRLRVLLLHGGPAATHEYFEAFDSFLPAEGVEYI